MVAEPQNHGNRLVAGLPLVIGIKREHRTSGHEVLPDQNPVFVAPVKECVRFINTPAPNAHHVAVQVFEQFQRGMQQGRVTAMQCIERDPVRAPDIDRFPVDFEKKLPRTFGTVHVIPHQFDGAQPDPLFFPCQKAVVGIGQFDGGVIQHRFAISARPPEFCIVHRDGEGLVEMAGREGLFGNGFPVFRQTDRDVGRPDVREWHPDAARSGYLRSPRRPVDGFDNPTGLVDIGFMPPYFEPYAPP